LNYTICIFIKDAGRREEQWQKIYITNKINLHILIIGIVQVNNNN
jgi:hypothetical protein